MRPRFKVGEQVILKSVSFPEHNGGPYTILKERYGTAVDKLSGKILPAHFSYRLEGDEVNWWHEASLRKYYPPSEMSFDELMQSLKLGVKT